MNEHTHAAEEAPALDKLHPILDLDGILQDLQGKLEQDWVAYRLDGKIHLRGTLPGEARPDRIREEVRKVLQPFAQPDNVKVSGRTFSCVLGLPGGADLPLVRVLERKRGKPFWNNNVFQPAAAHQETPRDEHREAHRPAVAPMPAAPPIPPASPFLARVQVRVLGHEERDGKTWLQVQEEGWTQGLMLWTAATPPPEPQTVLSACRLTNDPLGPRYK